MSTTTERESKEAAKHTPGPWRYEESTKTIRALPSNYWLCTMDSWDGAVSHEANAALIAAAPELLEALKGVVMLWDDLYSGMQDGEEASLWEAAKRAIAKAEGAQ